MSIDFKSSLRELPDTHSLPSFPVNKCLFYSLPYVPEIDKILLIGNTTAFTIVVYVLSETVIKKYHLSQYEIYGRHYKWHNTW